MRRARVDDANVDYTRDLGLADFLLQRPSARRVSLVYESHGVTARVSEELPHLLGRPELAPSRRKLQRLDRRERRVWRRAAACVTITRALAEDLSARHGPRGRVFVVPDGARPAPPPAPARSALAAYAGHLYPWKGVDVFVRSLMHAGGVAGLIVGGHPGEADLSRVRGLVDTLRLGDRVTLTGLVAPGEVRARLADASILVLPNTSSTISERYTSPLKLFEYLSLGRPIVASDLPAIREVLTDGESALLVPAGDDVALGRAIGRLAADPALSARLGAASLALLPHYTWDARARRLEEALEAAAA
jgi:glycosyltransferase involved in cell wall biosynthesis